MLIAKLKGDQAQGLGCPLLLETLLIGLSGAETTPRSQVVSRSCVSRLPPVVVTRSQLERYATSKIPRRTARRTKVEPSPADAPPTPGHEK